MNDKLQKIIQVDNKRREMLLQGQYTELTNSYRKVGLSFVDRNSKQFWQNKVRHEFNLDYLTNQRIKFAAKEILKTNRKNLLDIGVGQAYLEKRLSEVDHKIVIHGVDIIDSKYIDSSNLKYVKVKSYKYLPFKDMSFGIITALEVMEHLRSSVTFSFLGQVRRVLENNGTFIVSIPINENLGEISTYDKECHGYINPNSHMRNYNEQLILWELEYSGFEILKVYKISAFKMFGSILTLINNVIKRWQPNDLVIVAHKKQ